ncbi:hypothetical protein [Mastigocladopsis repens]|uniref:hypothetical protein n=1 Tax=Mastigocladopsis repens TaxID=221287 RepID=UPI0002E0E4E9|nr:hypothetical protein [Mastigocladopsis repens]
MKTEISQIKPTWQSLRKAILDLTKLNELGEKISENTILEKFQVLKQYLDYLLEPLFEELDILDYCLLYQIYNVTSKSETIAENGQRTYWASLWYSFLQYQSCHFCPFYPEETFKQVPSGVPYPSKEVLDKRTTKLKKTFSSRLRKLNAHSLIDIRVRWLKLQEELEYSLQGKAVYLDEHWLISIRATKKGHEKLKYLGYNLNLAYSYEVGKRVEFVPPEKYVEGLRDAEVSVRGTN